MKVAIVTDSNAGLTNKEANELGVFLVPMPFLIDNEEYFENINLTQEMFYNKLEGESNVSTSQPSIFAVKELWDNILKEYDEIVHIPMSSALSASYQTAFGAAIDYNGKVQVVDNKRISVTQKQSVLDALKLVKNGKNAKEIKEELEKTSVNASIYIMLSTLKYLKKGGRITPAAAAIGGLLKIKPVLQIQGEKLDKFAQVLTASQGKKRMIDQIEHDLLNRFSSLVKDKKIKIGMAYTNCYDKCLEFKQEADIMLKKYGLKVEDINPLSLSVACHIGPGAIAVAAYYKE